ERGDALELTPTFAWRLAEPQLVERADRERVEQTVGDPRRGAQVCTRREVARMCSLGGREIAERGVIAAGQHRPAQLGAARETVDPGHGVSVDTVTLEHARHAVVDVD